MSLLVFQHHKSEDPARLGEVLTTHGHRLRTILLHAGQPVPPDLDDVDGLVIMGGPMNVSQTAEYPWLEDEMAYIRKARDAKLPIVGICLGAQLIATALGGEVGPMDQPECGWAGVKQAFPGTIDPLHAGIPWDTIQFHAHGQQVTKLPPGGTPLSGSKACRTQAFNVGFNIYAFQYHFEWTDRDIRVIATGDPMFARAGVTPDHVSQGIREHYENYRRLGDRLAERLALLVFPIDKR